MIGHPSGDKALATAYLGTAEGQRYQRFVRGLHTAVVEFGDDSDNIQTDNVGRVGRDAPLSEANAVASLSPVRGYHAKHKPVLDLDMNVMVIPSSTRGHYHLYIDREMSWDDYLLLMRVMEHVGLLQPGYVKASHRTGASWLRLPWIKKGKGSPSEY